MGLNSADGMRTMIAVTQAPGGKGMPDAIVSLDHRWRPREASTIVTRR
jgi:hypothetical protein